MPRPLSATNPGIDLFTFTENHGGYAVLVHEGAAGGDLNGDGVTINTGAMIPNGALVP